MIFFLSTADTDLLAIHRAAAQERGLPPVRAANPASAVALAAALSAIQPPAGGGSTPGAVVVLRLLGGRRASPEGVEGIVRACLAHAVPLIALSGDGRPDPELSSLCSAPEEVVARVEAYLRHGGVANAGALLRYLSDTFCGTTLGSAPPVPQPEHGIYHPDLPGGWVASVQEHEALRGPQADRPRVGLLFYRAHWLSGNLAFVDALVRALEAQGCNALPIFCQSLRPPDPIADSSDSHSAGGRSAGACPPPSRGHGVGVRPLSSRTGSAGPSSRPDGLRLRRQRSAGDKPLPYVADRPAHVLDRYFFDGANHRTIDVLISTLSFSAARLSTPENDGLEGATEAVGEAAGWFERLGVQVLQALVCTDPRATWKARSTGLGPLDVAMQVALPEFDGRLITVPVCFKEEVPPDDGAGAAVTRYVPDEERCAALAAQAAAWARLRRTPNRQKRVAVVLGSYPARNGRIGNAVGLDTPASLVVLLETLRDAGYDLGPAGPVGTVEHLAANGADPTRRACPAHAPGHVGDHLAAAGDDLMRRLIAAGSYDPEFGGEAALLPEPPGLRLGNVFIGIQPPRGWGDDPDAVYHDPELPPSPPYVRFYRWLRTAPPVGWGAHALIHLGKHGTLEWLPGKAVGLAPSCAPDALLGDLPTLYPFIVDDPGEGTQAKRRAHAVLIGHLVPPLAAAGLHGDLAALERLIEEDRSARLLDPAKLPVLRQQIWQAIVDAKLDEDLALARVPSRDGVSSPEARGPGYSETKPPADGSRWSVHHEPASAGFVSVAGAFMPRRTADSGAVEADLDAIAFDAILSHVETYLHDLQNATIRDGLHILGRAPEGEQRAKLLDAMMRLASDAGAPALRGRLDALLDRTADELAATIAALAGRFVPPGPSGAPTRGMWNVLPTGRNFYSVDPQAIPSPAAWETGWRLADALLSRYLAETGRCPQTVGLVVWGTAAMRTHGDDVAQALALLGVRPVWQPENGRVRDVEPIPLAELGRPRIDVTLHISGFFRDAFPHLVALLDRAAQIVADRDEPEAQNYVAAHVRRDAARLVAAGERPAAARRRAGYRLFGAKPGCYGAGLLPLIEARNWRTAGDLARAYETWSAYAYGQDAGGVADRERFRAQFAAIDVATKNQDNREHDLFDSDDYFQYHGGMVAAARALRPDGAPPRAYFGDSADPRHPVARDLAEEARRVFRSRVVNPRWLAAMRRHGYKGAFEMAATVDYLFGYHATAGVATDWKYEQMTHAYVLDAEQQAFLQRSNPWALRDMAERLLEAAARGLWQHPDPETHRALRRTYLQSEGDLEAQTLPRELVSSSSGRGLG